MQDVSQTYLGIVSQTNHSFESKLVINGLITITEDDLFSMRTVRGAFPDGSPSVGNCVAGEIEIEMMEQQLTIPRMAKLEPFIRAVGENGETSEWIPKGTFYIDTRETIDDGSIRRTKITGYDAMLKAEVDFPIGAISEWPSTDIDVVDAIASQIGIEVDDRTYDIMENEYEIQIPGSYTSREVLGFIGVMYCGNWVINENNLLQLIALNGLPPESNYLIDESGDAITFGGIRILV